MNTPPQPSAASAMSDVESRSPYDILKALKLFVFELLGFGLTTFIFFPVILSVFILIVPPLAVILSGGETDGQYLPFYLAWAVALVVYGLLVGIDSSVKSDAKSDRAKRVAVQWILWTITFSWFCATGWPVVRCLEMSVAAPALLVFGVLIGNWHGSRLKRNLTTREALIRIGLGVPLGLVTLIGLMAGHVHLTNYAEQVQYVGKPAPAWAFTSRDNEPWSLDEYRGKVILLEYWTPDEESRCDTFAHLKELYERFADHKDFVMVSVSCGSRQESIDWFENHQASWGLLFLDASQVDIQPQRTPAAHIVDRDGAVTLARPRWPRDMTESSVAIERELERLLEKSPANDPRNTPD